MEELNQRFEQSQQQVKTLTQRPANEHLLSLYGLYKQAVSGDVTGSAPSMFKMAEHAKYQAWKALSGLDAAECKRRYVELVDSLLKKHS
ncbi:acyl-CoA-binding protein [Ferrimonas kyonanensis]|uniref:acyl-CoA-binding protein n=1 Tax=Ferrimonas kyonanensis TaxID=364763 RepID=UPI000401DD1F|nr:acyl-CoA-binding protein [Ferrimonas kyonanensis]